MKIEGVNGKRRCRQGIKFQAMDMKMVALIAQGEIRRGREVSD